MPIRAYQQPATWAISKQNLSGEEGFDSKDMPAAEPDPSLRSPEIPLRADAADRPVPLSASHDGGVHGCARAWRLRAPRTASGPLTAINLLALAAIRMDDERRRRRRGLRRRTGMAQ